MSFYTHFIYRETEAEEDLPLLSEVILQVN